MNFRILLCVQNRKWQERVINSSQQSSILSENQKLLIPKGTTAQKSRFPPNVHKLQVLLSPLISTKSFPKHQFTRYLHRSIFTMILHTVSYVQNSRYSQKSPVIKSCKATEDQSGYFPERSLDRYPTEIAGLEWISQRRKKLPCSL
jgi:hypothetical protein